MEAGLSPVSGAHSFMEGRVGGWRILTVKYRVPGKEEHLESFLEG